MKKRSALLVLLLFLVSLSGCKQKQGSAEAEKEKETKAHQEPSISKPAIAEHLGFATRVPANCDFYFATFYDGEDMFDSIKNFMLKYEIADELDEDMSDEKEEEVKEAFGYLGSEFFVFVGEGAGFHIKTSITTYRDILASMLGVGVDAGLKYLEGSEEEPDFSKLSEDMMGSMIDDFIDVIEKNPQMLVPSVVVGWKPSEDKLDECLKFVEEAMAKLSLEVEKAKPVEFERHGAVFKGYEVHGAEIFEELNDEFKKIEENELSQLTIEKLERALLAIKDVNLTLVSGAVDGRVIVYFGNGPDGFELAKTPEESLAAKEHLTWLEKSSDRKIKVAAYFSEPMVGSILPWLDESVFWEAASKSMGPPLKEHLSFKKLLSDGAELAKQLGQREISPFSAFAYVDDSWAVETRGGIVDPSIDYTAPLKMYAASVSSPFRAHWVQKREWNELFWSKLEYMGAIIELGLYEWESRQESGELSKRFVSEIAELNRIYRDEFRQGIGNEVAILGDLLGEMPPVPGLPEKLLKDQKVPRILIARPLTDRAKITAAGESWQKSVRSVSAWLSESIEMDIPAIPPQSIESGGVITWFIPLPFIGGDFVPGISIDENSWMIGTSRSLTADFSKAMKQASSAMETGMIVEVDLEHLVDWAIQTQLTNAEEIDEVSEDLDIPQIGDVFQNLKKFTYRNWLDNGKPRSLYRLEFREKE